MEPKSYYIPATNMAKTKDEDAKLSHVDIPMQPTTDWQTDTAV
jgi:hypothetical protein